MHILFLYSGDGIICQGQQGLVKWSLLAYEAAGGWTWPFIFYFHWLVNNWIPCWFVSACSLCIPYISIFVSHFKLLYEVACSKVIVLIMQMCWLQTVIAYPNIMDHCFICNTCVIMCFVLLLRGFLTCLVYIFLISKFYG